MLSVGWLTKSWKFCYWMYVILNIMGMLMLILIFCNVCFIHLCRVDITFVILTSSCVCKLCHRQFTGWMFDSYWRFAFKSWCQYEHLTEGISRVLWSVTSSEPRTKESRKADPGTMVSKLQACLFSCPQKLHQEALMHLSFPVCQQVHVGLSNVRRCVNDLSPMLPTAESSRKHRRQSSLRR